MEHDIIAAVRAINTSPAGDRVWHVVVGWYAHGAFWHNDVHAGLCDSAFVFVDASSPVVRSVSADH